MAQQQPSAWHMDSTGPLPLLCQALLFSPLPRSYHSHGQDCSEHSRGAAQIAQVHSCPLKGQHQYQKAVPDLNFKLSQALGG